MVILVKLKNKKPSKKINMFNYLIGELTFWGLLNFGKFSDSALSYTMLELPIFFIMGIIGGLTGALFCHLNYKLTVFRMR